MSDTAAKKKIFWRRTAVRAALVLAFLGLMVLVYVQGKGHTILIDNKDSADGAYKAFEDVRVAVDKLPDSEYLAGDRDMAKVVGQVHKITVDKQDGSAKIVKTIRIPLGADTVLLSLPKLVAGAEPYLEPFNVKVESSAEEDAAAAMPEYTSSDATSQQPAATADTAASADSSGGAVFYSEPGGKGTATTDSGSAAPAASSTDSSSGDSGGAVFYSEPGGQGTATH